MELVQSPQDQKRHKLVDMNPKEIKNAINGQEEAKNAKNNQEPEINENSGSETDENESNCTDE